MPQPEDIKIYEMLTWFLSACAGCFVVVGIRGLFKKRSAEDIFLNEIEVTQKIMEMQKVIERECAQNRAHCMELNERANKLLISELENKIDNLTYAQKIIHDRLEKGDQKFETMSRGFGELTGKITALIDVLKKNGQKE